MKVLDGVPGWLHELNRFLRLRSLFVLHGNIYDQYLYPHPEGGFRTAPSLRVLLHLFLQDVGYSSAVAYDVIDGFEPLIGENAELLSTARGSALSRARSAMRPALEAMRAALVNHTQPVAVVFDFASRLTPRPTELTTEESQTFLHLLKGVGESHVFHDQEGFRNILIFICDKQNDLPPWLFLDNPHTKALAIPRPDRQERGYFFTSQRHRFYHGPDGAAADPDPRIETRFIDLTEGMTYRELDNLRAISVAEPLPVPEIGRIIDIYRYGVRKSLWEELDAEKIRHPEQAIRRRVKGQDAAIAKAGQIIKRAATGLSGISRQGANNRPRGVMFLAGPTAVGKTELAKALAEHVFGDESALIRFDMSEYAHDHSDEKLLGSPPGYVGHDEGGQLTNRIKSKPFSLILFDEIEKAHPRLFDKFLQILDDGRITDGKGETVYFSESVIVFTSNLGMYRPGEDPSTREPNIEYGMPYEEVRARVMEEIERFFNERLGRPEIYNRLGRNFVVFDFIAPEVGLEIMDALLDTIVSNLDERRGLRLVVSDQVRKELFETHIREHLDEGGRGIHNRIEEHLINPLAAFLVDEGVQRGATIHVEVDDGNIGFQAAG